jgi:hypothetical protein
MIDQCASIGGAFWLGSPWVGRWCCAGSNASIATPSEGPLRIARMMIGRGDFAAWGADFARIQR